MFTKRHLILHLLAELEAVFSQPGSPLSWRKRELRHLGVRFGQELWVGRNLYVYRPGNITLGRRAAIGEYTQLVNHAPITIGDDFIGASNLIIDSGTHDPLTLAPSARPVTIGDRVWCGQRVTIIAGVSVGNDVVIGAGSLVNKDIPSNSIAVGVPARVIRHLDRSTLGGIWTWAKDGIVSLTDMQ